ncbi:MAG TPA: ABC transporter substrate-binding protein [Stellaceae bacterium]
MKYRMFLVAAALLGTAAFVSLASPVPAATLRWANDGDVNSMDPYARNETFLLSFLLNVYEPLVGRDKDLKLEPALATEWSQTAPDVWRFKLRQGVTFHDGSPFTADDVIFSYGRVKAPGSNVATFVATVKEVRKVDDHTVDMVTDGPDPILPEEITQWAIMSKAWAEKNNAVRPADLTKNEDFYATRNANGTGPFMLKSREPDVKTVLVKNPNWWGKPEHNLDEVVFSRIANDATRVAALISGDIDMIYNVPSQDMDRLAKSDGVKVYEKPELRTIFLGFDQTRDELLKSNVKGKNPFKDVRVRRAFYQAIDEDAIKNKIMRGTALPVALIIGPGINGYDKSLDQRYPYDPAGAKKLLAEAGYPDGFEVTFDCPTDRYQNDEKICQAVSAMLARIGIKIVPNFQTRGKYFAEILGPGYKTSFYMLGWTPTTYDAHNALYGLIHTRGGSAGLFNVGGYSNPKVDELTKGIQVETDPQKRQVMISEAFKIHKEEFGNIPLHEQTVVWAARKNVDLVQLSDNVFPLRYVTVK